MRILKSKKGVGTSVIADIFALLAYFIFFIVILILIALPTGFESKAQTRETTLKTDFEIQLMDFLRTSIVVDSGKIVSVGDYIADFVDVCDAGGDISVFESNFNDIQSSFIINIERLNAILASRFSASTPYGAPICFVFDSEFGFNAACSSAASHFILSEEQKSGLKKVAEVSYPTRGKHIVTAMLVECSWKVN